MEPEYCCIRIYSYGRPTNFKLREDAMGWGRPLGTEDPELLLPRQSFGAGRLECVCFELLARSRASPEYTSSFLCWLSGVPLCIKLHLQVYSWKEALCFKARFAFASLIQKWEQPPPHHAGPWVHRSPPLRPTPQTAPGALVRPQVAGVKWTREEASVPASRACSRWAGNLE